MTDVQHHEIEAIVRDLIEEHLADDVREAALDWFDNLTAVYRAARELGLVNE
jgi:hypothetical protein